MKFTFTPTTTNDARALECTFSGIIPIEFGQVGQVYLVARRKMTSAEKLRM